jgi:hypothetical protein
MEYFEALTCFENPAAAMMIETILHAANWAWEPVPDVHNRDDEDVEYRQAVYGVIVGFADPGDDILWEVNSVIRPWGLCLEGGFRTKPTTYAERFEQHTGRKWTPQG